MAAQTRRTAVDKGVILMALLIGLAVTGIALMAAVDVWTLARQRERESELLFVGDQYRQAIRRYYYAAPSGSPRVLPAHLADLLEDDRYPVPVRHLRRLYPDPITGKTEWGELRDGDRLTGVYSLSEAPPVKQAGFPPAYVAFDGMTRYRDWVFAFAVPRRSSPVPPPSASAPSPSTRPTRGNSP
jgi:type II secretory pathway pseudopilin PulG